MPENRSFFAELSRRKVYRAGLAYAVATLAIWGGVEMASQAFGLADGVLRGVIIVSVALLPAVLAGAWLFDLAIDWSSGVGRALIGGLGLVAGLFASIIVLLSSDLVVRGVSSLDSTFQHRLALPDYAPLDDETRPRIALSPDGQNLLYRAAVEDAPSHLWLLSRDELEPRPLVGTEDAVNPVFSPDGTRFAFSRTRVAEGGQELVVAPLAALGNLRVLADTLVGLDGATWGDDGYVYYDGITGAGDRGIMRVDAGGGTPEQVTTVDRVSGEGDHIWPHALPNGRGLLFTIFRGGDLDDADIAVTDLSGGPHRIIGRGVSARFSTTGHVLIVTRDGDLVARRFDLDRLTASGQEVPLATGLGVRLNGRTDLTLSRNGRMAYTVGQVSTLKAEMILVDFDGTTERVEGAAPANLWSLRASPDGQRVAFAQSPVTNFGGDTEVWVQPLDGRPAVPVTSYRGRNTVSAWSPDGQSVLFVTDRLGSPDIFGKRADGLGEAEPVLAGEAAYFSVTFSRDGEWRLHEENNGGGSVFWASRTDGSEPPVQVDLGGVRSPNLRLRNISPDGRWLAHSESATGDPRDGNVVVRSFPDTGHFRLALSADGGYSPLWSDDGRTLFYVDRARQMIAVDLESGAELVERGRRILFRMPPRVAPFQRLLDLVPGEERFLMAQAGASVGSRELVMVEGVFEMLSGLAQH